MNADLYVIGFIVVGVGAVAIAVILARKQTIPNSARLKKRTDYELLSGLPVLYYVLATICGAVLLLATIVNFEKLEDAERGAMIGYTVGSVLSMFAVGRVIQLLQQIRDK